MIVTFDVETTYDQNYSLRKMSTSAYILDHRYETIMAAIQVNNGPCEAFIGHDAVAQKLATIDWSNAALLAHNTRFDGAVLAWRFGIVPALYLDTLSMARATTHWALGRSSLAKVSEYLGLPPKGDEVVRAIGKRLANFSPSELQSYADYCVRDAMNCRAIFDIMRPLFPGSELRLIDLICRMYCEPQVQLNPTVLAEHLHQVKAEKAAIMASVAHIDASTFSSQQKFKVLLESYGVEVPLKISPTTGDEIPALAKNDRAFKEMLMDDGLPLAVQALLAARVNSKSTLEETRTEKLLQHSLRDWHVGQMDRPSLCGSVHPDSADRGWAAVPLKYYGARPGRLSGDGGENWQNFKRGSRIREAIEAPAGHRVVHRDASQIEARMVAWLAGCGHLIEAFSQKRDVYSEFATLVYECPLEQIDKLRRFVGKTAILGLGYGCGWEKFRHMLFIGNGGVSVSVDEDTAKRIVYTNYRSTYPEIRGLWDQCEWILQQIISLNRPLLPGRSNRVPDFEALRRIPVRVGFDALWLPNGMCISYPRLRLERMPDNSFAMVYDDPYGGWRKIYGAKCTENISQALARIIVTDIAVRVYELTGYHPFLSTHDSLDYCVPESDAEAMDAELERQFAIVPSWAPGLPLASEGGWGRTLLEAEKQENR